MFDPALDSVMIDLVPHGRYVHQPTVPFPSAHCVHGVRRVNLTSQLSQIHPVLVSAPTGVPNQKLKKPLKPPPKSLLSNDDGNGSECAGGTQQQLGEAPSQQPSPILDQN